MEKPQLTPAQQAGCCLASSKEECKRPPCPCNLDAWTPGELRHLQLKEMLR